MITIVFNSDRKPIAVEASKVAKIILHTDHILMVFKDKKAPASRQYDVKEVQFS